MVGCEPPRGSSMRTLSKDEAEFKEIVRKAKLTGCVLCGSFNDLDFHHVHPKEKKFLISGFHIGVPLAILKLELSKCRLLCSLCHHAVHGFSPPKRYVKNKTLFAVLQTAARLGAKPREARLRTHKVQTKGKKHGKAF